MNDKLIENEYKDEKTLNSILPSYSMYTSTIGMNVNVPETNGVVEPPSYDCSNSILSNPSQSTSRPQLMSNAPSISNSSTRTSIDTSSTSTNDTLFNGPFILADENTNSWQETILDNVHKLHNLTFESHKVSESIKIHVHFTKNVCKVGEPPILIDPSLYEYKQGDYLNGYITIENTSQKPIPFEMFYLLFEGNFMVSNTKDKLDRVPVKIRKFLEMFDFSGSWNEAHIDRFNDEYGSPYSCQNSTDPLDNTFLYFGRKRLIEPNRVYKRFFTFKIPDNLLDSECNEHNLSKHVELPPTIGLSRWETSHFPERETSQIKDFAPVDVSIGYGVMARFIGRKSTWEDDFGKIVTKSDKTTLINSKGDEYIILKELTNYIRIVKKTEFPTCVERKMKLLENKLMFDNLVSRVEEKIAIGKQLVKFIENNQFDSTVDLSMKILSEQDIETAKFKQSYKACCRDHKFSTDQKEFYEYFIPLTKRSALTGCKSLGTLSLKTPKEEYSLSYIPPKRFRSESGLSKTQLDSLNLTIPIDLKFHFPTTSSSSSKSHNQPPTIKSINAEFVALSLKSTNLPIPIELNHDLIFNKTVHCEKELYDLDSYTHNVTKKFRDLSTEIYHLYKKLGGNNFKLEKQLIDDLKSMCQIEEKCMNLIIRNQRINNEKFSSKAINWKIEGNQASTSFDLNLDLSSLAVKGSPINSKISSFDAFNLVPDFQSCFMARMYHIKVLIDLSNGDCVRIKIPVRVQKV